MKVCIKCCVEKDEEQFYLRNPKTGNRRTTCLSCDKERLSLSYQRRRENVLERTRNYYYENSEKYVVFRRDWADKNRHRQRSLWCEGAARRKARKLAQSPELTQEEKERVDYLYWLAKDLKVVSGQDYHVDHVIPIAKGGPHHPDNLQILPADLNLKKGAK